MSRREREGLTETSNDRVDQRRRQFQNRPIWPERGLTLTGIENPRAWEIIAERRWEHFISTPEPYDENIVRHFYAAMIPEVFNEFGSVLVGGVVVRMTMEGICQHYRVPRPTDLGESYGLSRIEGVRIDDHYSEVLSRALRTNGRGTWVPKRSDIKKAELHPEIALMMKWIKTSLAPSRHDNTVDAYVAKLLFHLQYNLPMDVGHVIQLQLVDAASNTNNTGILPFPCLITKFCRDAGVEVGHTIPPPPPFDHHTYAAQVSAADRRAGREVMAREGRRMRIPEAVDEVEADEEDDEDYNPAAEGDDVVMPNDLAGLSRMVHGMHRDMMRGFAFLGYHPQEEGPSGTNEAGPSNPQPPRRNRRRRQDN